MSNEHVNIDKRVEVSTTNGGVRRAIAGSKKVATGGEVLEVTKTISCCGIGALHHTCASSEPDNSLIISHRLRPPLFNTIFISSSAIVPSSLIVIVS
jgi:hypothetical protein